MAENRMGKSLSSKSTLTRFLQKRRSSWRNKEPELEEEEEAKSPDQEQMKSLPGATSFAISLDNDALEMNFEPPVSGKYVNDFKNANLFQRLTVTWARGLFIQGIRREIEPSELWLVRDKDQSSLLSEKIWQEWGTEVKKTPADKLPDLKYVIARLFLLEFSWAFIYMMGWLVSVLVTNGVLIVYLLDLLESFSKGEEPTVSLGSLEIPYRGFYYCLGFFLGEIMRSVCVNRHWELSMLTGVRVRAAVTAALFQKLTRLRRSSDAIGQLLNIVSNDVERLRDAFAYGLFIVTTPVSLIAIIILGQFIIGKAIWVGFIALILSVPLQAQTGKLSGRFRAQSVVITDERVTLMNEILKAAQLIKLYAWEESFSKKIEKVRSDEMVKIRLTSYTKAFNAGFSQTLPVLTSLITFLFHTIVFGETLTPGQAFSILALFNVSRFPLNVLPLGVRFVAEFMVAMKRISKCLLLEEAELEESTERILLDELAEDEVMIEMKDAMFTWNPKPSLICAVQTEGQEQQLDVIVDIEKKEVCDPSEVKFTEFSVDSLEIKRGTLVGAVGVVGGGKSSFFAALLGDMRKIGGKSSLKGEVAYVGQTPWVFNATVRDNILLGRPFDKEKFKETIRVCALGPDLKVLPSKELTEIGERGINLSGGQKARLALARAVYADADVYLFDDVLSAVDAHVSAHLWKECIKGKLAGKTIILATHALQYLPDTDSILVVDGMKILASGSFQEISSNSELRSLVVAAADIHTKKDALESKREKAVENLEEPLEAAYADEQEITRPTSSVEEERRQTSSHLGPVDEREGKLTSDEDRKAGSVSMKTVVAFAKYSGGPIALWLCFFFFLISEGSKFGGDAWLTPWSENAYEKEDWFYVLIYGVITLVVGLLTFFRGVFFAWISLRASQNLHDEAFNSVMEARMDFFQTTPLGRILARFSSDMDKVDVLLVDIAEMAISLLVRCFLSVLVICIVLPAFLVAVVPIMAVYGLILRYTRRIVRQMKRMDNMSRSPLLSEFQSMSHGLTSARTFRIARRSIAKVNLLVDETSRAFNGFFLSNRLIAINVDIVTTVIVTLSAVACVIFASSLSLGLAGLVLSAALQTCGIFQFATRQAAELEAQFTSVERLRYFIESTPRESQVLAEKPAEIPQEWPSKGEIEFRDYCTRYREGLPLVLKNLTLTIAPGSKTALCGRTGSGKSTTLLSCFRVLEASSGRILIDGIDIAAVPLKTLRSKAISVVPQDATLFAGTIRYNLDPLGEHTDIELWEALERVHLAKFVKQLKNERDESQKENSDTKEHFAEETTVAMSMHVGSERQVDPAPSDREGGLDFVLEQSGSNLSAGQRQLFCFARALLRKTRIICIDEGTSSVDSASDDKIQATLRTACQDVTLMVIAHRLQTVRNFDCICVLDQGTLLESGSPEDLIARPNGAFASMWQKSVEERSRNMENHSDEDSVSPVTL